jgi:hypothetical protein
MVFEELLGYEDTDLLSRINQLGDGRSVHAGYGM